MWIDHMYAYVARWGTIANFSCFALEGSHVRLKRMLRNSGGVSLLNDRSGLQCVMDNHALDDHVRKEGLEVLSGAVTKQRGLQRPCTTWSRARRERKGRENMVRRIVDRALRQRTNVTTKPTPDTVHSPTPGQLRVESIQLACTCAVCCCYALCMKREELSIFYSLWLRCFVDMLQYVGFLGRSQLFGSQVKVGAPTWHLSRPRTLHPMARQLLSWRAPSPVLARANCPILPLLLHPSCIPFPF